MRGVVFRPRHMTWGYFALLVGLFAVGGCVGLAVSDDPTFGCWVLLAWPALALVLFKARTRVVVDEAGVAKRCWTGGAFRADWADIESWAAVDLAPTDEDADSVTRRLVRLQVRGARWPAKVTDSEAEVPPFEEFVRLLRERIPDRETAEPVGAPDRGGGK
jgi:hypothetical protein